MSSPTTRTLIWIPIIHTEVDQGSMSESIRRLYVRKLGKAKWEHHVQTIENRWRHIQEEISALNLPFEQVRLYQDGLPVCGHELPIVQELAAAGSQNHTLLLTLIGQGATLTGTESPKLLLEEYALAQQVLVSLGNRRATKAAAGQQEQSKQLLALRDEFIARRIDETLESGRIGLLFLGMLHSLEGRLPADVDVRRLA